MDSRDRDVMPNRLPFWSAAFVALICLAILGLSVQREWSARDSSLKNAEMDMTHLARSLVQHSEDTFDLLDASILGIANRLELDGSGARPLAKLDSILEARKTSLPRIHALVVCDENGHWLAKSGEAGANVSDRDYFRHHKDSDSREAWIGPPVKSSIDGQWIVTISRRFNHPDGSFGGVVVASIGAEYFSDFYRQFENGNNVAVVLLSVEGFVLARSPYNDAYVGRNLSNLPLFRSTSSLVPDATYYLASPFDGLQRINVYRPSDRFPLVIMASEERDKVLAAWRGDAATHMLFVLALTGLIAVIGALLVRQLVQRQRLLSALVSKEADFRLLAEESSDLVTRVGLDERMSYVSPSSLRVVGWGPERLTGKPALAGVNPQDRAEVDKTVAALKAGELEEARIIYRTRHREAGEIWLESALRITRKSDSGEIDGVVAISRDITERKQAEDRLAILAVMDGLTELVNRRTFDERLKEEWARARRECTPLSLLMIDIDHFKAFNDQYGHPAGDECLRAFAAVLDAEARRPADMTARYGGEEFVVLMPNTDEAGCEWVGQRIREALRKLDIHHAANHPGRRVTASLGGATMMPDAGASLESSALVAAADRALYAAKHSGRDRLIMSEPKLAGLGAEFA
jgi:diguanylate cyclase (GGDEF)-like protein/PAS domain S-box-containing protein